MKSYMEQFESEMRGLFFYHSNRNGVRPPSQLEAQKKETI